MHQSSSSLLVFECRGTVTDRLDLSLYYRRFVNVTELLIWQAQSSCVCVYVCLCMCVCFTLVEQLMCIIPHGKWSESWLGSRLSTTSKSTGSGTWGVVFYLQRLKERSQALRILSVTFNLTVYSCGRLKFKIQPKLGRVGSDYVGLFRDFQLQPLFTVAQGHQYASFPFIK